jgi:hypothetical protein
MVQFDNEEIEEVSPMEEIGTKYVPPEEKEARWYFDYEHLYWEIKAHLYGGWIIQDPGSHEYRIKRPRDATPFMNARGVEDTMALFNGLVNKIGAITISDERQIRLWCRELMTSLAIMYYRRMDAYEMSPDKADLVIMMVVSAFQSNMNKSLGGRSLQLLGTTEKIVHSTVQQNRGGIFGRLGI